MRLPITIRAYHFQPVNPSRLTTLASLVVEPVGAACRYESTGRGFCWNFYHAGHLLKTVRSPRAVIFSAA